MKQAPVNCTAGPDDRGDYVSLSQELVEFDFGALAEFHYHVRRLAKAGPNGTRPVLPDSLQHHLLLNVLGLPPELKPTISTLANRLQIRHHSAVELIDRSVQRGLVERRRDNSDGRRVTIHLTRRGHRLARRIARLNSDELRVGGRELLRALQSLLCQSQPRRKSRS